MCIFTVTDSSVQHSLTKIVWRSQFASNTPDAYRHTNTPTDTSVHTCSEWPHLKESQQQSCQHGAGWDATVVQLSDCFSISWLFTHKVMGVVLQRIQQIKYNTLWKEFISHNFTAAQSVCEVSSTAGLLVLNSSSRMIWCGKRRVFSFFLSLSLSLSLFQNDYCFGIK